MKMLKLRRNSVYNTQYQSYSLTFSLSSTALSFTQKLRKIQEAQLLELPAGLVEDNRLCENLVKLQQVLDAIDREQTDRDLRVGHAADDCAEYVAEIVEIVPNLPGRYFIIVGKMAENCGQTSHGPQALVVVHGRQPGLQVLEDEFEVVACHVLVEAGVQ